MSEVPNDRSLLEAIIDDRPAAGVTVRHRNGRTFLILQNEFATVWVTVDNTANGVRLIVTDAETGTEIGLDPLELEAISRMDHRDFDERILERSPIPLPEVSGPDQP